MKIIVTGAYGQLGNELQVIANNYNDIEWHFHDLDTLDITSPDQIETLFTKIRPNYLINCAAYTQVDKAETDREMASLVNSTALEYLSKACLEHKTFMIHISTDYVYHHNPGRMLEEGDDTLPKGFYGISKLDGENKVRSILNDFIIIRTSWVYSSFGANFVKTMLRLAESKSELSIVSDQIGTPTYARDIAIAILKIIEWRKGKPAQDISGVYNFSNMGVTNWAEFAEVIFKMEDIQMNINPVSTEDYGAPAPRPKWSLMDKSKISERFNMNIPEWEESLANCLKALKDRHSEQNI